MLRQGESGSAFGAFAIADARAMGEFGAVPVVPGHVPGVTNTLPLDVQAMHDGDPFAAASLLALAAMATPALRRLPERRLCRH